MPCQCANRAIQRIRRFLFSFLRIYLSRVHFILYAGTCIAHVTLYHVKIHLKTQRILYRRLNQFDESSSFLRAIIAISRSGLAFYDFSNGFHSEV